MTAPRSQPATAAAETPPIVFFEAIARRQQVSAIYNSMEVQIAPHVLYTRDTMLYLAGIVTMRRGQPVQNDKLSIFKVAGLGDVALLAKPFEIDRNFDPADPRFAANTVFVVER